MNQFLTSPSDPEAAELAAVQDSRGFNLDALGFGAVLADDRLAVAPAADEHLVHGVGHTCACCQRHVSVVGGTHAELEETSIVREEVVLQVVTGVDFWKRKRKTLVTSPHGHVTTPKRYAGLLQHCCTPVTG